MKFQSTPSVWRVTTPPTRLIRYCCISIHTLRVEGDSGVLLRERNTQISIHTLRVEGDEEEFEFDDDVTNISIHTLRVEGDLF